MPIVYSAYQTAIFDFVKNDTRSAVISAVAGAGKTFVLTNAVKLIPSNKSVLVLAFNKIIAEELQQRINLPNAVSKTFHSLGFAAYRAIHGSRVKMDNNKLYKLLDDLVDNSNLTDDEKDCLPFVVKIVKLGKSMGIGTHLLDNSPKNWAELIEYHDVGGMEDIDLSPCIPICQEILFRSNQMIYIIDFDDMIYLPVQQKLSFAKFDYVLVDEAQDTSETQREILKGIMKSTSRLIACGDEKQSLYGFRGASSEAMACLQSDFKAVTLPLSISYRCSRHIVNEARNWVSHIESAPDAPDGSVERMAMYSVNDFNKEDAIICRNVAPLISMAYGLISRGVPVNMRGRDISKGLIGMIKKLKASSITDLSEKLESWVTEETARLVGKQQNESKVQSINDRSDCIKIFIEQAEIGMSVKDLINRIDGFFSDDPNGNIVLSTVHKFKGLEVNRCYILDESKFSPKWVKLEWQKIQEVNIRYVAITRAKSVLRFIVSNSWTKDKSE